MRSNVCQRFRPEAKGHGEAVAFIALPLAADGYIDGQHQMRIASGKGSVYQLICNRPVHDVELEPQIAVAC
ncbi:hypothetical protein Q2T52_11220 [Rhizobium oryzicola]|uniref:PapC-like C-terminal domain-containing protein n=1 Tax=Rhizobium oryzicola TaxID=1232668 RepID=A0ABT8SXP7_9HYPH|nr:hypothetical protein [Rhizobium oryzicola]MDO1582653.1 hypothetical protein [Rhizobium oryzicola]